MAHKSQQKQRQNCDYAHRTLLMHCYRVFRVIVERLGCSVWIWWTRDYSERDFCIQNDEADLSVDPRACVRPHLLSKSAWANRWRQWMATFRGQQRRSLHESPERFWQQHWRTGISGQQLWTEEARQKKHQTGAEWVKHLFNLSEWKLLFPRE